MMAEQKADERDPDERCCPPFDPGPWDGQEFTWLDRKFVKVRVRSLFHIPLNFRSVMQQTVALIEQAEAKPKHMITLADENSLWGADVYLEVTKQVPGLENVTISGTFLTRVFEGPYRNVGKWMRQMRDYVLAQGRYLLKIYCYYTTCPRCAKAYGKNYVVLLARV